MINEYLTSVKRTTMVLNRIQTGTAIFESISLKGFLLYNDFATVAIMQILCGSIIIMTCIDLIGQIIKQPNGLQCTTDFDAIFFRIIPSPSGFERLRLTESQYHAGYQRDKLILKMLKPILKILDFFFVIAQIFNSLIS